MKRSQVSGWKVERLGNVVEFQRGLTYSKKDEVELSSNIVLRANNVDLNTNALDFTELKYIKDKIIIPKEKKVAKGSLIICTASGSKSHLGKVALIDKNYDYAFGGFMGQITPKKIIDSKFLFYRMISESYKRFIGKLSDGVNINNLRFDDLAEFEIPLPPLPEQKRIVSLLDECFAALAQVGANAARNQVNAREVFDSTLWNIDAEKEPLGNLVNITTGKLNANAAVEGGEYPFFTCAREIYAIDNFAFDTEAILLAGNNASGDFNVKHYKGKFNAYQRTYVITVNKENKVDYRWLYFQLTKSLQELKSKAVGANTKFLKLGMIQGMQIPLPPLAEQRRIVQRLDGLARETSRLEEAYRQKAEDVEEMRKSVLREAFQT